MIQGAAIGLGALFMECNKVECPEVGVFVRVCVLRLMFVSVEMIALTEDCSPLKLKLTLTPSSQDAIATRCTSY